MKKVIFFLFILVALASAAQNRENFAKIFIGVNAAQNSYFGDLNSKAYILTVNHNAAFSGDLGIAYRKMMGYFSYEQGDYSFDKNQLKDHRNFLSQYSKMSFSLAYKIPLKKHLSLVPGVGISSWSAKILTDTLNAAGTSYYYWSDGSIRNGPETYGNYLNSAVTHIKRDYTYETTLGTKSFISVPLKLALYFDLGDRASMYIGMSYNIVAGNNIDLMNTNAKNAIVSNYAGISYVFMRKPDPDKMTKEQKAFYAALDQVDTDGDGVVDMEDNCPTTGKKGKINAHGCPLDGDNDGIIDDKDKEPKTAKHAIVDTEGKTITPADPAAANDFDKEMNQRMETSIQSEKDKADKELERTMWPGLYKPAQLVDLNDKEIQDAWKIKYENETNKK